MQCLKHLLLIIVSGLLLSTGFCQERFTISGYVRDSSSGEFLIGANVYAKELLKGTVTNQYGFYSLTIEKGNYSILFSFIGYSEFSQSLSLGKNIRLNVDLVPSVVMTQEVVITGERLDENVHSTQTGKIELDIEKIKTLPAFLGEVDLLKTIQLLPGVQSAGEGNSGFYVRGGGPDQNLILLDEAVVYNASHLFGFFSVFNSDAVKSVSLTKGGMPAQYGGRLSSVLDISMKEGNSKKFHAEGGIGYVSSRLTLEGPIKKDTSSFMVSARRTFVDLFLKEPFVDPNSDAAGNSYYFYDLNTKLNYRLSHSNRLFLSGYFGRDVFTFNNTNSGFKVKIPWGNATASLRWNHLFSDRLFMNTSFIFSDYKFRFDASQQEFDFALFSGIRDYNAKIDFTFFPSIKHNLKFGANYVYHIFTPSNASARSGDVVFDLGNVVRFYAHDGAVYISDEWDITDRFAVNVGVRGTSFMHVGPFERYILDDLGIRINDTITYSRGEKVAQYSNAEPRFSMRLNTGTRSSIKASYTEIYQYIHLAAIGSVSLPTDVWIPSSDKVQPQFSRQYALGFFKNFKRNMYESSVEVYYKEMKNQVEFNEGHQPDEDVRNNVDNNFVFGKGWSYGAEFFLKKSLGKFSGWIGYTLAWTNRKFEDLNKGNTFPFKYDRRHDASIVLNFEISKRWTLGAVWVYATGNALTLPQNRFFLIGPFDLTQFSTNPASYGGLYHEPGERNSFRFSSYHRLDFSATLKNKKRKKFESSWNFSVFNVYNRYNPYFIYFDDFINKSTGEFRIQAKQVSLFPILPAVTYNFKF